MNEFDDYMRNKMRYPTLSPFDNSNREPRIEIYENNEGFVDVRVIDTNTGKGYQKSFALKYNHNKGHRNFGGGFMEERKAILKNESVVDKLLMLFL